ARRPLRETSMKIIRQPRRASLSDASRMRRRTILKKSAYLRLGIGLMCTALFVLSLVRFQQNGWRENIVAFLIGLLSGYYYTSAWYVGRTRESGVLRGVITPITTTHLVSRSFWAAHTFNR